jgi:hypothetical protein
MRIVYLNSIKPSRQSALDTRNSSFLEIFNVRLCHLLWHGMPIIIRYRIWPVHITRLPIYVLVRHVSAAQARRDRASLAARVRGLDSDFLVLAVRKFDDASKWLNLGVFPESGVFGRDAPFRGHGRGSTIVRASPRRIIPPRWARCHGVWWPSSAEYWHIGEASTRKSACGYLIGGVLRNTMMRFCSVTPLILSGSKSFGGPEPSG